MKRDYITTYVGNKVYLPKCDPESIDIRDIAHALSYAPRFCGHTNRFYSVAEHSINASFLVPEEHQLQCLLHDATEAYLCDIPTPFKRMLKNYAELEADLWRAISTRFDVPFELHDSVKKADATMLMTERDALKPGGPTWAPEYEAIERAIWVELNMTQAEVEYAFLERFNAYQLSRQVAGMIG